MKRFALLALVACGAFSWSGTEKVQGLEAMPLCGGCEGSAHSVGLDGLQSPFDSGWVRYVSVSAFVSDGACVPSFSLPIPGGPGTTCTETTPCKAVVSFEWFGFDPQQVALYYGPWGLVPFSGSGQYTMEFNMSCGSEERTWTIKGLGLEANAVGSCDGC